MSKDFGPVSGYLDPDNKSLEQVTWRTGRPPLDKEFNLAGELFLRHLYRSGQICSGFLFSKDYFSPDVFPVGSSYIEEPGNFRNEIGAGTVADTLFFGPGQVAHVADMLVNLQEKDEEWLTITLPAAPTGVGVKRWDFVFIEVWRAPLTGDAATDTANGHRDANGKIFYNGWVDSPTGDNFVDDVLDTGVGVETSRRVQIQWRIRTVADVDLNSSPDGMDDTTKVFAQGPAASPSAVPYASQAAAGDPGLWISSGHNTTTVAVDGNIYAIPLCAVARRNQETWAQDTNRNGGTGTSPTGFGHDLIVEEDILDLRKTVSDNWDLEAMLKRNFAWLMDGKLKTYFEDHNLGGGERGTYHRTIDEVGPVDTPGATLIGEADGYMKHFSDAVTGNFAYETVLLGDRTVAGDPGFFQAGDQFQIALPVASDGLIAGVEEMGTYSGYGTTGFTVTGLNSKTLTITLTSLFDTIPIGARSASIFLKIYVIYPGENGLSRTPHAYQEGVGVFGDVTTLSTDSSLVYESVPPTDMVTTTMDPDSMFFKPSRTATLVVQFDYDDALVTSRTTTTTVMPNDVRTVDGIYDAVADPGKTTNLYLSHGDNVITHSAVASAHRVMIVDYISKEPMHASAQVSLYYRSAAQQTLNLSAGGLDVSEAKLHMLYAPDWLYTMTCGSGGHNAGYPYVAPAAAFPSSNPSMAAGDHQLNFDQVTSVDDFGTESGLIRLPVNVPLAYVPYFNFTDRGSDGEGRHYYETADSTSYDDEVLGAPVIYQPSVHAKGLQGDRAHRVVYPTIAMCLEDSNLGKRGTLLLLVFTRTSDDEQNAVGFTLAAGGDSCVALYRLKGNPIVSPRKYQIGLNLL